jgi:hypothetical protein
MNIHNVIGWIVLASLLACFVWLGYNAIGIMFFIILVAGIGVSSAIVGAIELIYKK